MNGSNVYDRCGHDTKQLHPSCTACRRTANLPGLASHNEACLRPHRSNHLAKWKIYIAWLYILNRCIVRQPWHEANPKQTWQLKIGFSENKVKLYILFWLMLSATYFLVKTILMFYSQKLIRNSSKYSTPCNNKYFNFKYYTSILMYLFVSQYWLLHNPVCGMVHIKEPLLLIGKSSLCGGSGFPFSLSEWFLTICLTPYNRK